VGNVTSTGAGACATSAGGFGVPTTNVACALLESSRRTIVDLSRFSAGGPVAAVPRHLPMNIDMAALAAALASLDTGELGEVLGGRSFNGIIYVTSTWRDGGPPSISAPPLNRPPLQAKLSGGQAIVVGVRPMCRTDAECDSFVAPDIVRIINATSLAGLPRGVTIVTNLPVQIVGDTNIDVASETSFLVGGDTVTLLSSSYTDGHHTVGPDSATGSIALLSSTARPLAAATQYRVAVLAGQTLSTPARSSHGVDGFFRVWEKWSNRPVVRGAVVVGFSPVFSQHPWPPPNTGSSPGTPSGDLRQPIDFALDGDVAAVGRAPPGVPVAQQVQTRSWEQ